MLEYRLDSSMVPERITNFVDRMHPAMVRMMHQSVLEQIAQHPERQNVFDRDIDRFDDNAMVEYIAGQRRNLAAVNDQLNPAGKDPKMMVLSGISSRQMFSMIFGPFEMAFRANGISIWTLTH